VGTTGRVLLGVWALGMSIVTIVLLASGSEVETSSEEIPDVQCFSALEGASTKFPADADYDDSLPGDEPLHEIHLDVAINNAGVDSDGDGAPDHLEAEDALAGAQRGCDLARSQRLGAALLVGLLATLLWAVTLLVRPANAPGSPAEGPPAGVTP
jgi:hypothetical protein